MARNYTINPQSNSQKQTIMPIWFLLKKKELNFAWRSFFILELWKVRFSSLNFEKILFYTWISTINFFLKWRNSYVKTNLLKVQGRKTNFSKFKDERLKTEFHAKFRDKNNSLAKKKKSFLKLKRKKNKMKTTNDITRQKHNQMHFQKLFSENYAWKHHFFFFFYVMASYWKRLIVVMMVNTK